jgi:hypothetical protein
MSFSQCFTSNAANRAPMNVTFDVVTCNSINPLTGAFGNILVENSAPSVTVNNIGHNSNRASLILNGDTVAGNLPFSLQQNEAGDGLISNFMTGGNIYVQTTKNGNIFLNPQTGFVQIYGGQYPTSSTGSSVSVDAFNNLVLIPTSNRPNGYLSIGNGSPTGTLSPLTASTGIQIVNSAGGITISNNNLLQTWTPVLSFSGASAGIAYTTQLGIYKLSGGICSYNLVLNLSSKGTSPGNAQITLPVGANENIATCPNSIGYFNNMASTVLNMTNAVVGSQTLSTLYQTKIGQLANVLSSDFTDTSLIVANGTYLTN